MSDYSVSDVVNLREEDLLEIIGASVSEGVGKWIPFSSEQYREIADKWINSNINHIRDALCPHMKVIMSHKDDVDIIASVADVAASVFSSIPVCALAALLLRRGLGALCDGRK